MDIEMERILCDILLHAMVYGFVILIAGVCIYEGIKSMLKDVKLPRFRRIKRGIK